MRNTRIVVTDFNNTLVTVARSAPVETTIIVQKIGQTIETVTTLKNVASDILGITANTQPVAPPVNYYYVGS
jgi:hypothetical protein